MRAAMGLGMAALLACMGARPAFAVEVTATKVATEVAAVGMHDDLWTSATEAAISLMAQPMVAPRPKETATGLVRIQALQDGKWIAFRLKWKDTEPSEAGRLGKFSDGVAIQFPVKPGSPPPIFMGAKDNPVHIYHWRAQYQADKDRGPRSMKDYYPNMDVDLYPMEMKDAGNLTGLSEEQREIFKHGKAAGNPQAYKKTGVDEIFAEGFGTSSVIENPVSSSASEWKKGEWTVVIRRAMNRPEGSLLLPGKGSFLGFAVWQGGKDEVGSRKSVTMSWTPLVIKE